MPPNRSPDIVIDPSTGTEPTPRDPAALERCDRNIAAHLDKFRRTMDQIGADSLPPDADPIGLDDYTDDVMLAELLKRAKDRASRTPAPAGALLALVATLQGANDLLRICQEDSHANR